MWEEDAAKKLNDTQAKLDKYEEMYQKDLAEK